MPSTAHNFRQAAPAITRVAFLAALALSWPATARVACALESNQWQHRQALTIDRAGVMKMALPTATLDLARPNLEDLRLVDRSGQEVPFVVERAASTLPASLRPPRTFRSTLAESTTQLHLETGHDAPLAAVLLATPAPRFLKAARIEVSSDGEQWETLAAGVPIFRQSGAEQLRLEIPRRAAARLRITIDDTRSAPIPFTAATLVFGPATPPPSTTALPIRIANREEFAGETVLTLDLGARHVPLAELEFVTAEPLFIRKVTLAVRELRDDAAVERTLATGSIFRVAADGLAPASDLKISVETALPSREVLVHISNQDSPPLAIDEIRGQQRQIWLVFRAPEPGTYTLLTGNPDAAPPRYDLAALAPALRSAAPSPLSPAAPELNPGYQRADSLADTPLLGGPLDPTPWQYRKAVQLGTAGVQQLELDLDVLSRAQPDFADVRLLQNRTQIPYLLERPPLSRAVALEFASREDAKRPRVSRWEVKLPRPGFPATQLTLTSRTTLFQRHLRVSEKIADRRGGEYERQLGEAAWSKTPGQAPTLVIPLVSTPETDTLVLETDNGDNSPITLEKMQAHHAVARLLFKVASPNAAAERTPLALYYGNRQAAAPRYDVQLVAHHILAAEKHPAALDAEERARADGWAVTALAKARGGPLFWGALALVVVVLLIVVSKLLPKPSEPAA